MATSQWLNNEVNSMSKSIETGPLAHRFRGYLPVVIDIETAGFNAQTDAILEIAISTLDMNDSGRLSIKETFAFDISPFDGANIEQSALDFTGIDPEDPNRAAIDESDALKEIFRIVRAEVKQNQCKRAIMVAHNANFDHQFILAAVERSGIKRNPFHPFSTMDTATLAGFVYGHTVLAQACRIANIKHDSNEAHSAAYDASITAELFCQMVNQWLDLGGWDKSVDAQQKLMEKQENSGENW